MAIDKESLKKVWNKYFKGQFSYKVLKEQFVPDEESKKEIDDLLEEIDSTPKEELVELEVKSNHNWSNEKRTFFLNAMLGVRIGRNKKPHKCGA